MQATAKRHPTDPPEVSSDSPLAPAASLGGGLLFNAMPVALALLAYTNSLSGEMFFDDRYAVHRNGDVVSPEANSAYDLFTHDYWGMPIGNPASHKSYRPLVVLTFRWNHMLHGTDVWGYHVVNVLCHSVASWLVLRCALVVFGQSQLPAAAIDQARSTTSTDSSFAPVARRPASSDTFSPIVAAEFVAAMFALHPIHTESVSGVVGRAELLCCCFFLSSFLLAIQSMRDNFTHWPLAVCATLSMVASVLCKETGITVMGCIFTYDVCFYLLWPRFSASQAVSESKRLRAFATRQLFFIVFSAAFLKWRLNLNAGTLPSWPQKDNPAQTGALSLKLMNFPYIYMYNAWLLIAPMQLCGDYSFESIAPLETWSDPRNALTIVFFAVMLWLIAVSLRCGSKLKLGAAREGNISTMDHLPDTNKNDPAGAAPAGVSTENSGVKVPRLDMLIGLALLVFPFLPSSNIFFPVGFLVAERVLYIPSLGYCFLFGSFAARGFEHGWRRVFSSFCFRLGGLGAGPALEGEHANVNPDSGSQNLNKLRLVWPIFLLVVFGVRTILRNEDWRSAESFWKSVIHVVPRNSKGHFNYGNVMFSKGESLASIKYFKKSLEVTPDDPSTLVNMATSYYKLNRHDDAIAAYEEASKYARGFGQYFNWGYIYEQRNNYDMAIKIFDMASQYDPRGGRMALYQDDPYAKAVCAVHLGTLLCRQHRSDEGLRAFYRAVSIDPSIQEAWMRMGLEHAVRPGEMDRAMYALDRAVLLDEASKSQIAHYLEQQGNRKEAARYRGTRAIVAGTPPRGMEFYGDSQYDTRHVYSSGELFTSGSNALNEDLRDVASAYSGSPSLSSRTRDSQRKRAKRKKRNRRKKKSKKNEVASLKERLVNSEIREGEEKTAVSHVRTPPRATFQKSRDGGMASDHSRPPPLTKKDDLYADDDW